MPWEVFDEGLLVQVSTRVAAGTGSKGGKTKANVKNAQQRYRERQKVRLGFQLRLRTRSQYLRAAATCTTHARPKTVGMPWLQTRLQEAEQKIADLSAELRTLHMKKVRK